MVHAYEPVCIPAQATNRPEVFAYPGLRVEALGEVQRRLAPLPAETGRRQGVAAAAASSAPSAAAPAAHQRGQLQRVGAVPGPGRAGPGADAAVDQRPVHRLLYPVLGPVVLPEPSPVPAYVVERRMSRRTLEHHQAGEGGALPGGRRKTTSRFTHPVLLDIRVQSNSDNRESRLLGNLQEHKF